MNKSSVTKYIVGAILVIAVVAYVIFANKSSAPTVAGTPGIGTPSSTTGTTGTPSSTGAGTPPTGGSPTPTSTPTPTTTPTPTAGKYKDGTYTGSVADAFYGNLQVVVTIQGGLITNITFPQAPSGGHSGDVSASALPVLKQEAIAAQGANVNVVSGATQDTEAFNQSLAVALTQAKN